MRSCLTALGLRAGPQPPGTEFLDAETKRQESSFKRANAGRDQNPGKEWPEIPAETPYLASSRKSVVCGDWMVVCAVRYEPVSAAIPHWKPRQSAVDLGLCESCDGKYPGKTMGAR